MAIALMRRHRRLLAGLAVAIVAVAVCLPGLSGIDYVVFELPWTLVPPPAPVPAPIVVTRTDERPLSLRSLLPSRAPPSVVA